MAVQIGIGLFTAQVPPDSGRTFEQEYREIVDLVRLAETLGFDSAWVSEHHGSGDGYMPSLLPTPAHTRGKPLSPPHTPPQPATPSPAMKDLWAA